VVQFLVSQDNSWPFRKPVDTKKIRDYLEVITNPMDLETVQRKVDATSNSSREPSEPFYLNMEEFKKDINLIFENARIYN
jgi:histone acetyltransferase